MGAQRVAAPMSFADPSPTPPLGLVANPESSSMSGATLGNRVSQRSRMANILQRHFFDIACCS